MINQVLALSPGPAPIPPPRLSTMGLILAMAENSEQAKLQLYDDFAPYLYCWLLKQLPPEKADDILIMAFVHIFKQFNKYNPTVNLAFWLFIQTKKVFMQHYPNKEIID